MEGDGMRTVLTSAIALAVATLCAQIPGTGLPTLMVETGERSRREAWVTVQLPPSVRGTDLQLRGDDGTVLPLQVGPDRQGWVVLPRLIAGRRHVFTVEPALRQVGPDALSVRAEGSRWHFSRDGRPMFSYVGDPLVLPDGVGERFRRGAYIHPVRTPTGAVATEDYPPNHRHHHGIWAAWTHTRYDGRAPDFWNMGDGTGRVEFEGSSGSWGGPLTAGLETRHRYVDLTTPTPVAVLGERWQMTAYAMGLGSRSAHVFDVVITQRVSGKTPLELPPYRYGGIGVRGRHLWDGPDRTFFVTADGRGRLDGHGTRATWAYMGGEVDGRRVGIAVLGHPDNLQSPQPMRIHPTEPFFNFAPQQAGAFAIRPGEPFVMRYRFIAFDGDPDARLIDDAWQDWATPVRAWVR